MKKRKGWKSKLLKKELKHLREQGADTLRSAKINFEHQAKQRVQAKAEGHNIEPCWECRTIAGKLGFAV